MQEEDANQGKHESKLHRELRGLEFDIKRWVDGIVLEIKTDPSSGVCRASAAAACFVAVISLLYALFNLVEAYITGTVHFQLSTVGTSFGSLYLSGWVGTLVSLFVGVMLVSAAVSFVLKSRGVVCVLGTVLTGLLIVSYVMCFLLVGDTFAFVNNEIINPLVFFLGQVLYSFSLDPYVVLPSMIKGLIFAFYIPYIVFPLLMWFTGKAKPQLIISIRTLLCIQVLFRLVLWVGDNLGGIAWFVVVVAIAAIVIWLFSGGSDSGDHSIYTNDLGEKIQITRIKKQ